MSKRKAPAIEITLLYPNEVKCNNCGVPDTWKFRFSLLYKGAYLHLCIDCCEQVGTGVKKIFAMAESVKGPVGNETKKKDRVP